jgi:hypothetical protein
MAVLRAEARVRDEESVGFCLGREVICSGAVRHDLREGLCRAAWRAIASARGVHVLLERGLSPGMDVLPSTG